MGLGQDWHEIVTIRTSITKSLDNDCTKTSTQRSKYIDHATPP